MSNPAINTVTALQGVQKPLYLVSQSNYIGLQGLVEEVMNAVSFFEGLRF
ncbi:Unknown protein sequence [Pseudomonas syringae pv. cilantro]|uniref:Uncharacterized protein n=1 Tax=Pseudomonas syringae pv. cilantro TaxID=81035 RepID=A0A0N0GFD4_PSESX|nr:Unknown protein sequence [Pseudomonas syringae pv. cilantro]